MHDLQTGDTTRVSVDSIGTEADGAGGAPSMSGDGHHASFTSEAANLVSGDTNQVSDVFLRIGWRNS